MLSPEVLETADGKSNGASKNAAFIETLVIPVEAKALLRDLTPARYVGLAAELAKKYAA